MYRYISLVWNESDPRGNDTALHVENIISTSSSSWRKAHNQDGLVVYHSGARLGRMRHYPLKSGAKSSGVILGKIFSRGKNTGHISGKPAITDKEIREIIISSGRRLITAYWGRYVAFIYDEPRRTHHILRDPTGAFPCLFVDYRGILTCAL